MAERKSSRQATRRSTEEGAEERIAEEQPRPAERVPGTQAHLGSDRPYEGGEYGGAEPKVIGARQD